MFADYALKRQEDEIPLAIIEAKKLGSPLESKEIHQMVTYASVAGVHYAGLTDGDHWQIYDVFRPVPLSDRCVLNISIAEDPEHQCILKLLLLWHSNLVSHESVEANSPLLGDTRKKTPVPNDNGPPHEQTEDQKYWVPLAESGVSAGDSPPELLRFPDGKEVSMRKWANLLPEVVTWLGEENLLKEIPFLPNTRSSRYILNKSPVHLSGTAFRRPKKIRVNGRDLYVECNHAAPQMIRLAISLLHHHNVDPMKLRIRLHRQ